MKNNIVRHSFFSAIIAGIWALALYIFTIAPGLPPGHDSAELIAVAASGGIAHPPGYPLYTILAHAFVNFYPNDPILAVNIFSAICGALAVAILALGLSLFCESPRAGVGAAFAFSVATTPWRLSVGAEVFALHLTFVSALVTMTAWWWRSEGDHRKAIVNISSFIFGLACAHHQTIVLVLLPLGLFFYLEYRRYPKRIMGFSWQILPCFLAGLLPYLYLPWKASQQPMLNWGDPSNFERFLWVVLRQGYGTIQLSIVSHSEGAIVYHLWHWVVSLSWWQFPAIGLLLGLFGALKYWNSKRSCVVFFLSLCLLYGPIWSIIGAQPANVGYIDMMERFYATSYLGFAGLIALGISYFENIWNGDRNKWTYALIVGTVCLGLTLNYSRSSARDLHVIDDAVKAMVDSIPAGALVITINDLTSGAFMYATAVEKRDMQSIPAGLAYSSWYRAQLPSEQAIALENGGLEGLLIAERRRGRDIVCEVNFPNISGTFVPYGLMYKYFAPGEHVPDRLQASIESLMYLEKAQRHEYPKYGDLQPFWVPFYEQRWKTAYKVLLDALPARSPMRQIVLKRIRGDDKLVFENN